MGSAQRTATRRVEDRLEEHGGAIELLRVPAFLFRGAVAARSALYASGILPATRLDVPVVSIGNLTAGGTGKTPFCAWTVRALQARGLRPGIASRGYKSAGGAASDEGALLARTCPGVAHAEDRDRVRAARRLLAGGADAIVLDDGFQHRRLARDLDLVLVDATRPFGTRSRALLPRGLLREPPTALARADAVVITRSDAVDPRALDALETELARFAPGRPIARSVHAPRAWRDESGAERALDDPPARAVDLASGLGNPAAFEATVRALGIDVREHRAFPDHHRFTRDDVAGLGVARPLVVSAKDAVKLAPLGVRFHALEIEIALTRGAAPLEALLDALPHPRVPATAARFPADLR